MVTFEEKTAMEIQAESVEHTTNKDKSFRKIGIMLKIASLGIAFLAIALMSL